MRAARAWKYTTKAQREVWDMKAREHDNQQPLIAERVIQSLQTNASKSHGAVSLNMVVFGDNNPGLVGFLQVLQCLR
jgi:hypothetical protein